jgi:hypothetical protein
VGVPLLIAINHFLASCNQQAKKLYICQQKYFKFILGYKKGVWFLGSSKRFGVYYLGLTLVLRIHQSLIIIDDIFIGVHE